MIPGKLLVGSLAVEHHFQTRPASLFEHAPLGKNTGTAVWFILVPSDALGQCESVFYARIAPMRSAVGALDDHFHIGPFVHRFYVVASADAMHPRAIAERVKLSRH